MKRKILTAIEGVLMMVMFISVAGLDDMTYGNAFAVSTIVSLIALFITFFIGERNVR